jgi:UTP-glucose-1-phosphate uridylyltransferase
VSKRGIIEIDIADSCRVTSFLEKPDPRKTTSRLQCPCFYLLHETHLKLIKNFLDEKKEAPLTERDATGNLLKYDDWDVSVSIRSNE